MFLLCRVDCLSLFFFFFNDPATTEIYTLSLHDALPILPFPCGQRRSSRPCETRLARDDQDRKSTRLNSSHSQISYAVFCLKKKKKEKYQDLFTSKIPYLCYYYHLTDDLQS